SPRLHELMLHNATVWRCNRPISDPGIDVPHLRLENRLLPATPPPADMVAIAACFYGILHSLVHERRPLWSRMSFEQATEAFQQCARWGLEARVRWPKVGRVRVADLLLEHLIPQAMEGLRSLGAEADVAAHYGGILSERARTGRNGARRDVTARRRGGGLRRPAPRPAGPGTAAGLIAHAPPAASHTTRRRPDADPGRPQAAAWRTVTSQAGTMPGMTPSSTTTEDP